eukprot:gene21817-27886_t
MNSAQQAAGSNDALTWLPLEFPPHIRVILSVTIPPPAPPAVPLNTPAATPFTSSEAMTKESFQRLQSDGSLHTAGETHTPFGKQNEDENEDGNIHEMGEAVEGMTGRQTMSAGGVSGPHLRKSRILQELDRRGIPFIVLKPLDKNLCRSLVETFIQKSVNNESASLATGPYITNFVSAAQQRSLANEVINQSQYSSGSHPPEETNNGQIVPGFLLFENQIAALLNHTQGGTPLFLRLFLRCLQYAVSRGYSLWEVYDNWMRANSVPALLVRILETLEQGAFRHRDSSQEACDKTMAAGGLPALRTLYSWHPSFQVQPDEDAALDGRDTIYGSVVGGDLPHNNRRDLMRSSTGGMQPSSAIENTTVTVLDIQNINDAAKSNVSNNNIGGGSNPLSTSVSQNLGDQQWVTVAEQVDRKLQLAMANANQLIEDTLINAKQAAVESNTDYVTALVQSIRAIHLQYAEANRFSVNNSPSADRSSNANAYKESVKKHRVRTVSNDMSVSTRGDDGTADEYEYQSQNNTDDSDVDSLDDGSVVSEQVKTPFARGVSQSMNMTPFTDTPPKGGTKTPTRGQGTRASSVAPMVHHITHKPPADPSEGLTTLPIYLRGGITTAGFGEILGNALALLYVSRQGLREHELWRILSTLQHKKEKSHRESFMSKETKAANSMIIRSLATQILQSRGELRDIFKSDDTSHTGYISHKQVVMCVKKIFPQTRKADFLKLLEFIEINTQDAPAAPPTTNDQHNKTHDVSPDDVKLNQLQVGDRVHYEKLLSLLVKLNKHFKFGETKVSNMKSNHQGGGGGVTANLTKQSMSLKKKVTAASAAAEATAAGGRTPSAGGQVEDDDYDNFNLGHGERNTLHTPGLGHGGGSQTNLMQGTSSANSLHEGERKGGYRELDEEDDDEDETFTLGPVIEESLLSILSALGVLHSPENKVLILPSDSEPFRKVILEEYILNRGGKSLHYWHHLIIQYFQTEPNSLRKCEELPWHLKICKKWNTLRDTLVDLRTFDLMFNNDLKDELMEYWLLLTEGPLYVNDPAGAATDKNNRHNVLATSQNIAASVPSDEDDNVSTYSHILREIDQATEQRISVRDARKKLFKNQIQPFDVVEELNQSLETWVTVARPSPMQIHKTITQISKFLAEFSKLMRSTPTFRRIGIDLSSLTLFGVSLEDIKDITSMASAVAPDWNEEVQTGGGSPHKMSMQSPSRQPSMKTIQTAAGDGDNYFEGSAKVQAVKFPTEPMIKSNLYPYLRWIWMQFPWLALHPAMNVGAGGDSTSQLSGELHDATTPGHSAGRTAEADFITNSDNARLMRVWNVKKSDPTVPVFETSQNRKLAAIKPRTSLSKSLERNVEVTYRRLYGELTAPSHIAQVKLGARFTKDKYRRSYEQDKEANKNIPFAYHGARINKSGSLFPSYDAAIRKENKKKLEGEYDEDGGSLEGEGSLTGRKKKRQPVKFNLADALAGNSKSTESGGFFLTELDSEITRMSNEEYVQSHRVERAGGGLIKDEVDLEFEASLERIARMKTIRNKLNILKREKITTIADLDNQINLRNESDALLISEVNASELLIKSLNERNLLMEQNLLEARQLHDGYTELLKILKNNPPYIESHVKALEVEVELAEKQFADLVVHRTSLYQEAERLDTVKRRTLQERIDYYKGATHDVLVKKKQVQREIKHMKDPHSSEYDSSRKSRGKTGKHLGADYDDDTPEGSVDSYDSDSVEEEKALELSKPVIHFINALVRKANYGDSLVKDTDKSFDDIKNRVKKGDVISKVDKVLQHARKRSTRHANRENMNMEVILHNSENNSLMDEGGWHSGVTSQQPFGGRSSNVGASSDGFMGQFSSGGKRKFSREQQSQMKESLRSLTLPINGANGNGNTPNGGPEKESFRLAVQKTVTYLFEKTESTSADEFIDRFNQGQKLLETMKTQQILVDSKLAQLRTEHHELYSTWSDITFMAEESDTMMLPVLVQPGTAGAETRPGTANSTATVSRENLALSLQEEMVDDDRYLDNQLFKKEVQLQKNQRRYDNSVHIISEVQTSVAHIMNYLVINSKLLNALAPSTPPELKHDSDIIKCIMWCEDRIVSLNEALTMDANRPTGASAPDENKPMSQRQVELAELIYAMNKDNSKKGGVRIVSSKGNKKQNGNLAKGLINNTGDKANFVSSPRGIMIPPLSRVDKLFDSKMDKTLQKRDKRDDQYDNTVKFDSKKDKTVDIQRFLSDGLNKSVTKELSRKANLLNNKHQGRHLSYGLVLDDFLNASNTSMAPPSSHELQQSGTHVKDNSFVGTLNTTSVNTNAEGKGGGNNHTSASAINSPTNSLK